MVPSVPNNEMQSNDRFFYSGFRYPPYDLAGNGAGLTSCETFAKYLNEVKITRSP
jgi:hypothetical protein